METQINAPDFWSDSDMAAAVSKDYEDIRKEIESWENIRKETADLLELAKIIEADDGAAQRDLESKFIDLEKKFAQMEFAVLFNGPYDQGNAIFSIHAGTGGVDAMDWASMLLRMYLRFAERHGFAAKVIDETAGGEAGIKSAVIEISGRYAYGWLKSENGVHRLVRISPFDAEKMRHTSFALVEVLPETEAAFQVLALLTNVANANSFLEFRGGLFVSSESSGLRPSDNRFFARRQALPSRVRAGSS